MPGDDQVPLSGWAVASVVSSSLIGPVIAGVLIDSATGSKPWGTVVGVLLGLVGCLAMLIRMQNRNQGGGAGPPAPPQGGTPG